MTRVLLVPDLPLERWPSMDRYAHRLHDWLESTDPGFEVRLAASIGDLTRDRANGRTSGGYPRWWAQDVDPTKLVLPGPLHEPQRYVARYVAGRRPTHQRGAVRGGPRVFLRGAERALPGPGGLAHPRRRVCGAACRKHRGAQERAPGHPYGGATARRGGRVPAAGRRTVLQRSAAADRAAGPAPLRTDRPTRGREHVAAGVPRGGRAALPFLV